MHATALLLATATMARSAVAFPAGLTVPACVACREDPGDIRSRLTDGDWQAILRGDVVTAEVPDPNGEADCASVRVTGLVPAPPAAVWSVLADFESRPHWQSHAKEVRIARIDGDRVWVDERMSFFFVPIRCRIVNTLDPEHGAIDFELDPTEPHDIGGTKGSWTLRPFDDGTKTLVSYRAWIDTGRHVPAVVQSILLRRELPELVGALREEVRRIAGAR